MLASASYIFARCIITVFVTQRIDSSVIERYKQSHGRVHII